MISIKTPAQIQEMAEGGKILAAILRKLSDAAQSGNVTTRDLDVLAKDLTLESNAMPAFLGYRVGGNTFPASLCVSINDEVVHGIPSDRMLQPGDVVGLDMGIIYKGWYSDSAVTIEIKGSSLQEKNTVAKKLIHVTKEAMMLGIAQAQPGNHVGDIGHAVQKYVEQQGFGVVRDLVGHGIGRQLHEEPHVPNFGKRGTGPELKAGMVICIEPMITVGDFQVKLSSDHWTYTTKDGSLSAHFEHTVAITKEGPVVLTQ